MNTLKDFTHKILPWIVAAIALVLFLVTLNGWVTLPTLALTSRLTGWDGQPMFTQPLHFLLTWPIRLLPGNLELIGLNVFSAVCGALTIGLLARSVSLLPHDRTREQRQRESGELSLLSLPLKWVPPLFAGLALALQLTFWENATSPSGEMLDLLLFAYAIRCLLEFRVTENETWLAKLALVYGIGITNNWAMIGFFPLFVIALLWIKGLSFFKLRFLMRMIAYGLIGLSFYFLLPIIHMASSQSDVGFFEALRKNWGHQKSFIFILPFISVPTLRAHLFMLSLTSIIPVLLIGVRWRSFRGETSASGGIITNIMFRVMHIALFAICVWVFFDPKFSGRLLGYGLLPFLTFYFLTALSVGYLLGYILLVFGKDSGRQWEKSGAVFTVINRIIAGLALLVAVGVPAGLIYKNWQSIRVTNGPLLSNYAKRLIENLPTQKAIILSDDLPQLVLARAAHEKAGKTFGHIPISTVELGNPEYRARLQQAHPEIASIFDMAAKLTLTDIDKLILLNAMAEKFPLYYLHPSFGFFFESFYAVPHGLNYELQRFPAGTILPPKLNAELTGANEKFWTDSSAASLAQFPQAAENSFDAQWIGTAYSRGINNWGVQQQKQNRLSEAEKHFKAAVQFNPENEVAVLNSKFNANLRAGKVEPVQTIEELGKTLNVASMNRNGPVDELNANLLIGQAFAIGNNLRQAAQYFSRVLDLAPEHPAANVAMTLTYLDMQQPKMALARIQEIRNNSKLGLNEQQKLQLLRVESLSYLAQGDVGTAEEVLLNARKEFPKNEIVNALMREFNLQAAALDISNKQPAKAIDRLNALLKTNPDDSDALSNRALAFLQADRLDDAKRDYRKLEQLVIDKSPRVHYGLAEVALRQKDTNEAIKQYQIYLEIAPEETAEYKQVSEKLKELQSGQPK